MGYQFVPIEPRDGEVIGVVFYISRKEKIIETLGVDPLGYVVDVKDNNKTGFDLIPKHIRNPVRDYIQRGFPVGGFLTAVICNNLKEAFQRADHINRTHLEDIVKFFCQEAPGQCWGSENNMLGWIERKGRFSPSPPSDPHYPKKQKLNKETTNDSRTEDQKDPPTT